MKLLPAFASLAIAGALCAAEIGERHTETAGGFSYCPPKGWTFREFPGLKYRYAAGPASGGFAPNINVVDEMFPGSLQDYVKANLQTLTKTFKQFKNLGQSDFKTDSDLSGVKLVTQSQQQGKMLRQTFFLFEGKNTRKFVVTCSALAEGGDKLDAVFEASIKTFSLAK